MAETDILLTIGLDVKDAVSSASNLSKEVEKIFKNRKGASSPALQGVEIQLKKTYHQLNDVIDKMNEMMDVQSRYDELAGTFSELTEKAADLKSQLDAMKDDKGKIIGDPEEAAKLYEDLQATRKELTSVRDEMIELEKFQAPTEEFAALEQELEEITKKMEAKGTTPEEKQFLSKRLAEVREQMDQLRMAGKSTLNQEETDKYQQLEQRADSYNDKLKQLIVRYQEVKTKGAGAFINTQKVVNALKASISKLAGLVKKAFSAITRGARSSHKPLGMSLKTILGYALGIRSLYALFSKLRAVVKEAFTNLYKDNNKFKKSVDELKGSLTTLKNSFASAFQPIVSMAIPYIQSLIEWVTKLMDQIARFTAAAVGQKYYMKAIKQTGDAAAKAKRQLAGFDELNVLNGDGSGGQMFEEVPIDEEQIDLLAKLREVVAQMESVGNKFGTAIRDALNSIHWDKIQTVVNLVAEGIGNFINGLVRVEGLGDSIGNTIAEIGNTWIGFQQTLLDTIDFEDVGNLIGDTLQSWVDNFDWEAYGQLWATKINSVFETIKGITDNFEGLSLGISFGDSVNSFMQNLNWNTINEAVAGFAEDLVGIINGFLQTTDWSLVGETLSQGISQLFDFIGDFIADFDAETLGQAIISFISGIDWLRLADELVIILFSLIQKAIELLFGMAEQLASNIADLFDYLGMEGVAGFFRGIEENLKTSVQAIKTFFTDYVINPIKDFFGIHSPSTLFADFGKMLIQGLINGITSKFASLGEMLRQLKEKFFEKFTEIKIGVVNIVEKLWEAIKTPINNIIGGFEFLVNCVINALNKMINACNSLQFDIPDWIPSIGGESFGLNIPTLNEVSIPRLAQGAVIPPNKEFMAMLGDQKSGTNVEAPLTTIQQAMIGALQAAGIGGEQPINIYLGTKLIYSEIKKLEKRDVVMGG